MIIVRSAGAALVLLATGTAAACAAPGAGPDAPARPSALTGVPAGCDITTSPVRWSEPTGRPQLTRVTLFRDYSQATGTEIVDEPFVPSVGQVAAPAGWVTALASSLSTETGKKIQNGPAVAKEGGYSTGYAGNPDPAIPEHLLYEGVESVTAGFTVGCASPIAGTFTSWTRLDIGGVTCGAPEEPADLLAQLARRHCPRTPSPLPAPGGVSAVPIDGERTSGRSATGPDRQVHAAIVLGARPPRSSAGVTSFVTPALWLPGGPRQRLHPYRSTCGSNRKADA